MSNKPKRSTPYPLPSRRSSRSTKSNQASDDNVASSCSVVLNPLTEVNMPSTSSMQTSSGPSWEDFKRLQDTVSEMSTLIKDKFQSMETNVDGNIQNNTVRSDCQNPEPLVDNAVRFQIPSNSDQVDRSFNDNIPAGTRAAAVQSSINEYIQSFTNTPQVSGEDFGYQLPGRPIDMKISDKVKQKIWSHEYIDLYSLLDPDNLDKQSFTIVSNEGEPLRLSNTKANKTFQNLGQWCSAFEIYITVYCGKFPAELPKMMTYMNSIKNLAHRSGDYVLYDKEFRYLRQTSHIPWDMVHTSLWLECRDSKNRPANKKSNNFRGQNRENNRSNNTPQHPIGYCFRFHSFGKCGRSSCTFKHACYKCNDSPHSVLRCAKAQSEANGKSDGNKQSQTKTQ